MPTLSVITNYKKKMFSKDAYFFLPMFYSSLPLLFFAEVKVMTDAKMDSTFSSRSWKKRARSVFFLINPSKKWKSVDQRFLDVFLSCRMRDHRLGKNPRKKYFWTAKIQQGGVLCRIDQYKYAIRESNLIKAKESSWMVFNSAQVMLKRSWKLYDYRR